MQDVVFLASFPFPEINQLLEAVTKQDILMKFIQKQKLMKKENQEK